MDYGREDPYEVLGVPRGASLAEISHRYRILTHIFHPDRFATMATEIREEAERRMKTLNVAYDTLKRRAASFDGGYEATHRADRDARERAQREARERAQARERAERQARERAERQARERAERQARERAERERKEREARQRANQEAWERTQREMHERAERVRERVERDVRESAYRWARDRYDRDARVRAEREARERAEREARERRARRVRLAQRVAIGLVIVVVARVVGLTIAGASGAGRPPPPVTVRALDAAPTDAGIDVRSGQVVTFAAEGAWCTAGSASSGACGTPDGIGEVGAGDSRPVVADSRQGTLLARAGDGPWFAIGANGRVTMPSGGRLFLLFNDAPCCYADNSGEITVRVEPG